MHHHSLHIFSVLIPATTVLSHLQCFEMMNHSHNHNKLQVHTHNSSMVQGGKGEPEAIKLFHFKNYVTKIMLYKHTYTIIL
jgi:hypothetical protein